MKHNWVATFGNAVVLDDLITFEPGPPSAAPATASPDESVKTAPPHAILRSNIQFEQGEVVFEVKVSEPNASALIGMSIAPDGELYAGLNSLGAPYGMGVYSNTKWEGAGGVGFGSKIPTDTWLPFKLVVRGSNIDLYFNDVKVVSSSRQVQLGALTMLLQSSQRIEVRNVRVVQQHPICFVAMQFTPEFNVLYQQVIKPVCEEFNYRVLRADDFYTNGLIIEDITNSIRQASLIIADITPNNPNVFYEVGFAHGIGKATILLSDRTRDKLPFDVSGFRTLFYENTINGKSEVEARLRLHLQAIHGVTKF